MQETLPSSLQGSPAPRKVPRLSSFIAPETEVMGLYRCTLGSCQHLGLVWPQPITQDQDRDLAGAPLHREPWMHFFSLYCPMTLKNDVVFQVNTWS